LILRIIIKIDATRCQIFRLKCTKIVFGWGSAGLPQTPLGELTALPRPPSWIKGWPTSKGKGGDMGREGKGRKGRGRQGRGGEGEGGEGREGTPNILLHPQFQFSRNMPVWFGTMPNSKSPLGY